MAETELREPPAADNTTPIQYLHALWERANAIYDTVDGASPAGTDPDSKVKASWFSDATMQVHRQAYHLQLALLNEQPATMEDAVILAGHLQTHGSNIDFTAEVYRKEAFEALERALASLFTFMSEQVPVPFDGWMAGTLAGAKREIALRTGHPEAWEIKKAAA